MATSVFGAPITRKTLSKSEEYMGREVSTRDMAEVAFLTKNEDGKDVRAREFLEERRAKYAIDFILCLIYNATGDTIRLQTYCDAGDGFVSPCPYPMLIMNGQWGAYLKRGGGAVVYGVKNEEGFEYQVAFTYWWVEPGRVYTEIRQRDYFKAKDPWINYLTPLNAHTSYIYQAHEYGLSSFATLGGTTKSPVFEGIITLDGAWPNYTRLNPYQPQTGYYQPPPGYHGPRKALVTLGPGEKGTSEQEHKGDDASMATEDK